MLKRATFLLAFFISACVTVNIYFPAAVERAATRSSKKLGRTVEVRAAAGTAKPTAICAVAVGILQSDKRSHAQEADINVSNPAIRAIKDSIKARQRRDQAVHGWRQHRHCGRRLLAIRNTDGLNLKERQKRNNWSMPRTAIARISTSRSPRQTYSCSKRSEDQDNFRQKLARTSSLQDGGYRMARATGRKNNESQLERPSQL